MSGPITTSFVYLPEPSLGEALLEHLTPAVYGASNVLLALAALREAQISYEQYQQVLAQARLEAQAEADRTAQARAARITQHQLWLQRHAQLTNQVQRLRRLLTSLASPADAALLAEEPPPQPVDAGEDGWAQHLQTLGRLHTRLQSALARANYPAPAMPDLAEADAPAPGLPDLLHSYAMEQALRARLPAPAQEHYRQAVLRVLARLQPQAGATVPASLEALGARVLLAPDTERAENLLSQLRLAVQQAQTTAHAQEQARQQAGQWLARLGAQAPADLARALEAVAAGEREFDDGLRLRTETCWAELQAEHRRLQDQAAAAVLTQSLRDLGYEVSDVGETLFTEGGLLHFQREGWENYFVRLRVDAQEQQINFNVVRAPGEADASGSTRLQDTLAEDRWCREFPQLQETLAARGLALTLTRRLEAGELPVQVVPAASLPQRDGETRPQASRQPALRQRPLN